MTNPDPLRSRLAAALGARYTLERELTGGGMARVFVAHEVALNRRVVIKTLAPELAASLSAERFDREIQLVAALQHPNIVGVHASGAVDGAPWFSMPFVEGDSLRARLAKGPMSEGEAVGILRDVARALAYAHDRGVIHRDIKPDNILLADAAAVVTDFGIAKAVTAARTQADGALPPDTANSLTSAGISLGTPAYMAPEQAAADATADRRVDLYALGCVAFELVAGRPPFTGGGAAELLRAHLLSPPPAIPASAGVSGGYAALVARCLAKDPAQRPDSARDVLRTLEQLGGAGEAAAPRRTLLPAVGVWAATLGATYVLARAAVVGIGLPDFTVAWATGAAALGLPVVLATWWIQRTARRAELATPTWTPGGTLTQGTMAGLALKARPYATWRRARRAGGIAVAGVALLVAGVMGLRQLGLGPAASLAASGRVRDNAALLLADFSVGNGDPALGESLTQGMRTALERSSAVRVVSPGAVGMALQRMRRDPGTPVTPAVAREVAQRNGIPLVVTGRVASAGSGFMVTVALESTDSGTVLAPLQRGARGADDLLEAIDWLARRLRERVGESLRDVNRTPPLEKVTTRSLPALQAYSRAVTLGDVQGRFAEAIVPLEEAVRLDSTFASAWRKAAVYAWNIGRPPSAVLRFAREAYRHRERVPPDERAEIEAYYLAKTGTRAGAAAYLRIAEAGGSPVGAALQLRALGRFVQAESLLSARLHADSAAGRASSYQVYLNLAGVQQQLGQGAKARQTVAALVRSAPGGYWARLLGTTVAWQMGGVDSLAVYVQEMARSTDGQVSAGGVVLNAIVAGMRGRLGEHAVALRLAEAAPRSGLHSTYTLEPAISGIVTAAVHREQTARGVARLDSLRRADPQRGVPPLDRRDPELAIAYAQLGRPDLARPLLAGFLGALDPEERLVAWARWQMAAGEIALARGEVDSAVAAFRRAANADSGNVEPSWTGREHAALARTFDRGGRADSAALYYGRVADGVLPSDGPLVLPIALRRLGELAEGRGDLPEAIRRYRAFAQLWRDADPELQPQVADVRRRIAALDAREARGR